MGKKMMFAATLITIVLFFNAAIAEEITVVGTGSGMTLVKAVGDKFYQENPDVQVKVPPSIGSSGGIKAVGADQYKLGRIARKIKETEAHYGLTYQPVAKMPIVFFLHKGSGVKDLTPQQICDIYSGKVSDWQDVGGEKGRIRVVRREDGDSSLKMIKALLPGFKEIVITEKSKTTFNDQETTKLVEEKAGTIAFGTYINARNYDVDIPSISGKKPMDQDYPYFGTLALIFKPANNIGMIKKFIQFSVSPTVHDTIIKAGGLPF